MPNKIVSENQLPGNPQSEWDLVGIGDANIVGFATDISVNRGSTIHFKINTDSTSYRIDIYRLGYYGGDGARKIATIQRTLTAPQIQGPPIEDLSLGLVDAGNWAISASWAVPSSAVTGLYIAKLIRQDATAGANHIPFVVRDDGVVSDILFQTSDTTWQAYNSWGGYSLYGGGGLPANRAFKVSYNRPYNTRGFAFASGPQDWIFGVEYPMIRWLERNGYDISYVTGLDVHRTAAILQNRKIFVSVGHDEYWSREQRTNVEARRDAGMNLAFFSGNECYWKIRWENSIAEPSIPNRTMVCYKESWAGAKIDPSSEWTGTWRDPRFSPPSNGGRAENGLTGTIFTVDSYRLDTITVPYACSQLRFWRNTSIANLQPGQTGTLITNYLGYEWDEDLDNGARPAGLFDLSLSTVPVNTYLRDYGSPNVGPDVAIHSLTIYRAASGAIVFGAGTVYWAWGLDANHDNEPTPTDATVQQATVNLFADMGVQAQTLQTGLVPATASTDTTPPTSVISSPTAGASFSEGQDVTISGTATDVGGVVAGIEVSTDNGATWHRAIGTTTWTYHWIAQSQGSYTIRSRGVDDSGNLETATPSCTVTVTAASTASLWTFADTPGGVFTQDSVSGELGVRFLSANDGNVHGIRFYKGIYNRPPHSAHLWTDTGTLLASANFSNETLTGWQTATFAAPVPISAGVVYRASYHTRGFYSSDNVYFLTPRTRGPLTALSSSAGGNGVFAYGAASVFPSNEGFGTNYWVDVVFEQTTATPPDGETLFLVTDVPASVNVPDTSPVELGVKFRTDQAGEISGIRFHKGPQNVGPHEARLWTATGGLLATATFTNETSTGWQQVNFAAPVAVAANTTYVASYHTNGHYSADGNYFANSHTNGHLTAPSSASSGGNGVYSYGSVGSFPTSTFNATNYWVDVIYKATVPPPATESLFGTLAPATLTVDDTNPVELGVKFKASTAGHIVGIRFYKGPTNIGPHVGRLWTQEGTLLASAIFRSETANGWQEVMFSRPVAISAGTTYVASYHTRRYYSADVNYFSSARTNGHLTAPASSESGGNGVYAYGPAGSFPTDTFNRANYWVDVIFDPRMRTEFGEPASENA